MAHLIDKSALVAEIDELDALNIFSDTTNKYNEDYKCGYEDALESVRKFIDTLEVKEVDISSMADEYYDALMKESYWMDVDTMGHCRLAYYNGCKDVLNKIQKGE